MTLVGILCFIVFYKPVEEYKIDIEIYKTSMYSTWICSAKADSQFYLISQDVNLKGIFGPCFFVVINLCTYGLNSS